jgi:predicted AAA+ superfamily ATPase
MEATEPPMIFIVDTLDLSLYGAGLPLDSDSWQIKMDNDILNAKEGKKTIEEYIYDNISKFSDQQLDMFDDIKRIKVSVNSKQMFKVFEQLEIPTKDKDGKDSINESIINKSKYEFVPLWLDIKMQIIV